MPLESGEGVEIRVEYKNLDSGVQSIALGGLG
jgi:hypothetical protein